jgi:hypothetical protein
MSTICVYPMSPTYSSLPRLNTLVLLIFTIHGPADNWATKGALAALMVRTVVISLHAIALLAVLHHQQKSSPEALAIFDLDNLGAWSVLGAVGTAMPMLLGWAPSLRQTKARPLVRIWGLMTIVGAVCAYAAVDRARKFGKDQTGSQEACAAAGPWPMRGGEESVAFSSTTLFNAPHEKLIKGWDIAGLLMMAFGAWSCLRLGRVGQSALMASRLDVLNPIQKTPDLPKTSFGVLLEKTLIFTSLVIFWGFLGLHERYLFQEAIPELEQKDSFEQWSCWAATALVVMATVLNWTLDRTTRARTLPATPFAVKQDDGTPRTDIAVNTRPPDLVV